MALFGSSSERYAERRFLQEGDTEISERAYNLIIGGVLLWGFLLNYITVHFFGYDIARSLSGTSPLVTIIGYLVLVFIGSWLIAKPDARLSFLGYNLIALPIGVTLCGTLGMYSRDIVLKAVEYTGFITLLMMIAGMLFPGFFLRLGRVLFIALLACTVGFLITSLFGGDRAELLIEWGSTAVFCLYIGYDWARANACARTVDNAVDLAASLYLDIINLFLRILRILGNSKRDD